MVGRPGVPLPSRQSPFSRSGEQYAGGGGGGFEVVVFEMVVVVVMTVVKVVVWQVRALSCYAGVISVFSRLDCPCLSIPHHMPAFPPAILVIARSATVSCLGSGPLADGGVGHHDPFWLTGQVPLEAA